jgi:hypothetical protein
MLFILLIVFLDFHINVFVRAKNSFQILNCFSFSSILPLPLIGNKMNQGVVELNAMKFIRFVTVLTAIAIAPAANALTYDLTPTGVTQGGIFANAWSNQNASLNFDDTYSTCTTSVFPVSATDVLWFQFPANTVPPGDTLDGIEVIVEGFHGNTTIDQNWVSLVSIDGGGNQAGTIVSTQITGVNVEATDTIGSPTNLYSIANATAVNSPAFRVGVAAQAIIFGETFSLDSMFIRIYTTPHVPAPMPMSPFVPSLAVVLFIAVGIFRFRRISVA